MYSETSEAGSDSKHSAAEVGAVYLAVAVAEVRLWDDLQFEWGSDVIVKDLETVNHAIFLPIGRPLTGGPVAFELIVSCD